MAHVAALNPSGAGLKFLLALGENINIMHKKVSTAHYAAVCPTSANLQILIEQKISLHAEDEDKKTPLMWALEAVKPLENIKTILESIESQSLKDFKDSHKKMAVHYAC